jgi:transcription initiation factor TFIID TATA-box-binding protein
VIVYRPPQFVVTLLIFLVGKAIVGGTTDREEAKSALQRVQEEITALDRI